MLQMFKRTLVIVMGLGDREIIRVGNAPESQQQAAGLSSTQKIPDSRTHRTDRAGQSAIRTVVFKWPVFLLSSFGGNK